MAFLNWKTVVVILVNTWVHVADGLLVVKPQDTQVLAGQVATLNCSTSSTEDVHWYFGTNYVYVYAGRKLVAPYNNKLKVEVYEYDGATAFNLVFPSAKPEDAGMYVCRDTQGSGNMSSAEITVFTADGCRSNMKPDGVVIPNDCNIDPDEVQLSCGVTFNGKNPPQLEWKKVPDNGYSVAKTECQTTNNRTVCNTSIAGDRQLNRSSYVCQTVGSSQLNTSLCNIEVKNLIYARNGQTMAKSSVGNEVQCNTVTSQTCLYKWKHSGIAVSTSRTMMPDRIGLYQCEAECNIRDKRCIVYDYAYISEGGTVAYSIDSTSSSNIYYVVGICVLFLLLIVAISTAIYFVLHRKRKDSHQQLQNSTSSRNDNGSKLTTLENGTPQEQDSLIGLQLPDKIDTDTPRNDNDLKSSSLDIGTRQEQVPFMQSSKKLDRAVSVVDEPEITRTIIHKAASKGQKAVFGLAILGEELFVLSHNWPDIEVFGDLQKLESRREISLNGHQLELPWGMQSNSKYNCLYIVDKKKDEEQHADIVRIDSEGNVETKWTTDCIVCRLSVTSESDVIVTSLEDRKIWHYKPDGELKNVVELPLEIVSPWVALKRDKDTYIISYGNWGDSQHGVCVIDKNGKIGDRFGENKGQSNDQVNVPVHMTAYSDGHILVADKNNNRVVLLSPELKFLRAIFTQACERYPNRLCLDKKNKRLLVSDNRWISNMKPWTHGRVLVFDMSSIQTTFNINAGKN